MGLDGSDILYMLGTSSLFRVLQTGGKPTSVQDDVASIKQLSDGRILVLDKQGKLRALTKGTFTDLADDIQDGSDTALVGVDEAFVYWKGSGWNDPMRVYRTPLGGKTKETIYEAEHIYGLHLVGDRIVFTIGDFLDDDIPVMSIPKTGGTPETLLPPDHARLYGPSLIAATADHVVFAAATELSAADLYSISIKGPAAPTLIGAGVGIGLEQSISFEGETMYGIDGHGSLYRAANASSPATLVACIPEAGGIAQPFVTIKNTVYVGANDVVNFKGIVRAVFE